MFSRKTLGVCCVTVMATVVPMKQASAQCGKASWYHEGSRTASGERYRPDGITAAHKTLPLGTIVQVQHQRSGRTVTVRINDRGPFIRGRIIDLSRGAKRVLGMDGVAPVCITVLGRGGSAKVASADWSPFGGDESTSQPRKSRQAHSRSYGHKRGQARVAVLKAEKAEARRQSRRQQVAQAEVDSDDSDSSETASSRNRLQAHTRSRAHSRQAYGYRNNHAGWPGDGWSEEM